MFYKRPLKLLNNRVWRTYTGGKLIERWQGLPEPRDNEMPEEWVSSVVNARNSGREHMKDEGLSKIQLEDGSAVSLKQLIESDPEGYLGKSHVEKFGSNTAVLVKILDSAERLTIQVHPDRDFARDFFNSAFGKTEAWYILGGREINGEKPYVLHSFKKGVTKELWAKMFYEQDIEGMIQSLHKFYIEPGQIFIIQGGVPHAIGPGCFLVEIQEPTDYTLRVERTTPKGYAVPDGMCHQGAGFDNMLQCFHYEGYTYEEAVLKWCPAKRVIIDNADVNETILIDKLVTDKFSMNSINIRKLYHIADMDVFSVMVAIKGEGVLIYDKNEMLLKQGDQIFLPAGIKDIEIRNDSGDVFELIRCFPPL